MKPNLSCWHELFFLGTTKLKKKNSNNNSLNCNNTKKPQFILPQHFNLLNSLLHPA